MERDSKFSCHSPNEVKLLAKVGGQQRIYGVKFGRLHNFKENAQQACSHLRVTALLVEVLANVGCSCLLLLCKDRLRLPQVGGSKA